ncbi:Rox3 mediator complex subunit family protein [Clavispora lusitaniae]|uniref:Rox3 mediator complex subunit family protein n=1 Tax=Clavispora lusitaniae TaxID=36911 RepID=UPI00202C14E5|nr:Rox3 mediator complex subunit family protein [Clavispora lusitaniae]
MTNSEKDPQGIEAYYLIDRNIYSTKPSLARVNSDGSKSVKLRKSYKNHISDLPGKHQIPGPKPINGGLLDPNLTHQPDIIKEINGDLLSQAFKFDKTPINGIPGFNTADLAINDQHTLMRGDDMSENDDYKKKRKKRQQNGSDIKRQHIG